MSSGFKQLNVWISLCVKRRADRHAAAAKPKTGPRCRHCSKLCASEHALLSHLQIHASGHVDSATSSSNSTDFSSSSSSIRQPRGDLNITVIAWNSSGVASYGALGHVSFPRLSTISILVHFGVNLIANYPSIVYSLRDQLVQMSTTHSSFDLYCISHKTISHRAAAAPGPEVHRECPMT